MFTNISTPEQYQELIDQNVIAIDVRTEEETSSSKIPNIKTGYDWLGGEFLDKFEELSPENSYLLVCKSGNRSMQACMFLASNGFDKLYNLEGGMTNWTGQVE